LSSRRTTRPRRRRAPARLIGLASAILLAGCGHEPVTMPTLRMSTADQAACTRLDAALPKKLDGQEPRKTSPAAALGGAWGDPAIVAVCGVDMPASFGAGSQCQVADGVAWYVPDTQINDTGSDVVMTTAGYQPVLQVTIPSSYRPNGVAAVMVGLAPIVKADLHRVHTCQ
jgi:Protein of unknown function (DUF3515)